MERGVAVFFTWAAISPLEGVKLSLNSDLEICVCVCVREGGVQLYACGCQRATSNMWVLGIKLRSTGLVAGTFSL